MNLTLVAAVFFAGLFAGTLLNLLVVRIPLERFGGWPVHCTRCGAPLAAWQLLPVIGWLAQGGKARCCGRQLNPLFPLLELLYAAALAVFAARYGLSAPFWYLASVAAVLLVTGAIDWLHRYIYTLFILGPALLTLIAAAVFAPGPTFRDAIVGALVGGVIFALLFLLAKLLFPGHSAPFGLGDVYLAVFLGAALGLTRLLGALFYGVLLAGAFSIGIIVLRGLGRPNLPTYISYGSFLCIGALAYLMLFGLR